MGDRAVERGVDYLYGLRLGLAEPELISLMLHPLYRRVACGWIGTHIQALNAALLPLLVACHASVLPQLRPDVRLFAVPLSPQFGLDGFCCLHDSGAGTHSGPPLLPPAPISILLDLGVLEPPFWLSLVAHEYAHALVASSGHDLPFQRALSLLCRGLDLDLNLYSQPLSLQPLSLQPNWQQLPTYPRRSNRLAFWWGS